MKILGHSIGRIEVKYRTDIRIDIFSIFSKMELKDRLHLDIS